MIDNRIIIVLNINRLKIKKTIYLKLNSIQHSCIIV